MKFISIFLLATTLSFGQTITVPKDQKDSLRIFLNNVSLKKGAYEQAKKEYQDAYNDLQRMIFFIYAKNGAKLDEYEFDENGDLKKHDRN